MIFLLHFQCRVVDATRRACCHQSPRARHTVLCFSGIHVGMIRPHTGNTPFIFICRIQILAPSAELNYTGARIFFSIHKKRSKKLHSKPKPLSVRSFDNKVSCVFPVFAFAFFQLNYLSIEVDSLSVSVCSGIPRTARRARDS